MHRIACIVAPVPTHLHKQQHGRFRCGVAILLVTSFDSPGIQIGNYQSCSYQRSIKTKCRNPVRTLHFI
jgi:hypothetical protein